jgi:hypothetical protein
VKSIALAASIIILAAANAAAQGTPGQGFAWSENAGWINFSPTTAGSLAFPDHLEGYAWAESVGWIKLGIYTGGGSYTYTNSSATDWGVNRSGTTLTGFAWSETSGWITFAPLAGGATIDPVTGAVSGFVWSENLGWIHMHSTVPPYGVAFASAPVSQVPTLSTWVMMLLGSMLALSALHALRSHG